MGEMDDVISEFLLESHENLDRLDRDFVAFEEDPSRQGLLPGIFRTIHTIKGTCGFLGFSKLEALTHIGETLLGRMRDGTLQPNTARISALLAMVDAIRNMLGAIEATETDGENDYGDLRNLLTVLAQKEQEESTAAPVAAAPVVAAPVVAAPVVAAPVVAAPVAAAPVVAAPVVAAPVAAAPVVAAPVVAAPVVAAPVAAPAAAEPVVATPVAAPVAAPVAKTGHDGPSVTDSSVRVDVGLLGRLMNLVGELVLTRNQLLQFNQISEDLALSATTQRLNLITSELQEQVMRTRMQTIGSVWSKFPRLVRDLCTSCGKQVRLEMEGQETEVDRTLLDAIKDPLTHIIRNSVDHGIETPDRRRAAGKPVEGTLWLRAFHQGGQVNIEILDDGGGIAQERVRRKAIERGLITPDAAQRMTEQEVTNLIFLPGFSTAEKVTNVSGRGVGMDVVRTNIEQVGGSIKLESREGEGTRIRIRIPLTLAIILALIVRCGNDRYAIPQASLVELIRIKGEDMARDMVRVQDTMVYRRRGRLLPVLSLARQFGIPEPKQVDGINLVVLQTGDQQFGVIVDGIADTTEIVVKPLGRLLKDLGVFAGATIMGDGGVALILDINGLAQQIHLISETPADFRAEAEVVVKEKVSYKLLIMGTQDDARVAMMLDHVDHLEEINPEAIEHVGSFEVIQHRGEILSLIRLSKVLAERRGTPHHPEKWALPEGTPLPVIIHTAEGRTVGIIVDYIYDIIDDTLEKRRPPVRAGVLYSAVLMGRVTEIIDIDWIVSWLHKAPTDLKPADLWESRHG